MSTMKYTYISKLLLVGLFWLPVAIAEPPESPASASTEDTIQPNESTNSVNESETTKEESVALTEIMSEEVAAEIIKDITSPLSSDFTTSGETMPDFIAHDYGGLSGNTDGFDGFQTLTGDVGIPENFTSDFTDTGSIDTTTTDTTGFTGSDTNIPQ